MKELDLILDVEGDDYKLHFHPESLVVITFDLKEEGYSDAQIAEHLETLRATLLEDFKEAIARGEIDEDVFEDSDNTGCGDPNCPNCGSSVVYH